MAAASDTDIPLVCKAGEMYQSRPLPMKTHGQTRNPPFHPIRHSRKPLAS
jgi:hypothetical protein